MSCRLNKNGYIIITLLDNYTVVKKLRESEGMKISSQHYEIVFKTKKFDKN